MHLLSAQAGAIQQEGEAIDLAQSPGAYVFASSADSELAMLAGAADRAGEEGLRLANILRLSNNLSVDMWLEKTVAHARLAVLRLIGGPAYFQYGVDELTALCASKGIPLVLLPGDANPDPILADRSNIHPHDWLALHRLFVAGGPDNADAILRAFTGLAAPSPSPLVKEGARRADEGVLAALTPKPFPRFGLWHPKTGMTDEAGLRALHVALTGQFFSPPGRRWPEGPDEGDAATKPPYIPILFYRAALEGAGTATLEALVAALESSGLAPVPLLVSSLKEGPCVRFVRNALAAFPPSVILNLTAFALGIADLDAGSNPFAGADAPVVQLVQSGRSAAQWAADPRGLSAKDMAMYVVMPELDGRLGGLIVGHKADAVWHGRTQCPLTAYAPDPEGIARAAALAGNWARLRHTPPAARKVAIILSNYPIRDGRLANGVGYDAPESTARMLMEMEKAGYCLATPAPRGGGGSEAATYPKSSAELISLLTAGPTNANPRRGSSAAILPLARYAELFARLPDQTRAAVAARWGDPAGDPFVRDGAFHLPAHRFGNVVLMLQPARGYHLDETLSYHDPALVPPHAYVAAYLWLRHEFGAHAMVHNGKHGTLEWLPGKAVALDGDCYPDALWGQLPHIYPFIVNDPGEGTQAKRRTGAVIIDHLVPPLTRAETYGPLKDLEALLDEYYAASGMDRRRLGDLKRRILDFTRDSRLDSDIGLPEDETEALIRIDNFLCDLKEAQIRDGLHVFGRSPAGELERDLAVALARVPRGEAPGDNSLIRALADDLRLGFDPLTAALGAPWTGPGVLAGETAPDVSSPLTDRHLKGRNRRIGDVVSALESMAADLIDGKMRLPPGWTATGAVLRTVETLIRPRLRASGPAEMRAFLAALDGRFVAPGPSGAPSRGRLDVLPTGRNFYSVDARAVPTPSAWELGRKSAENLVLRHLQDHGHHLRSVALSVWGTANMRTGGDDIAQALALIGARPAWDPGSLRLSGYEIVPLARLGRPRVDVTLRISGFFRDAFPAQIALFDRAVRAIGALDEPEDDNPIAARMRAEALGLMARGKSEEEAALEAGARIFGSRPGTYGTGLGALIDSGQWRDRADLARRVLDWGQYAYGAGTQGIPLHDRFAARLGQVEAVVHNQDNREHDLLDSDNYYQFEGGLSAAAETLSGRRPVAYHNDHSRPGQPRIRTLEQEVGHVMRSRVVNPKWLRGMMRHGYRGAFEIIATLDFMFAFAATTGAVKSHHFDLAFEAFIEDDEVRNFILAANRAGYDELIAKFRETLRRGFWSPRSNFAHAFLEETP